MAVSIVHRCARWVRSTAGSYAKQQLPVGGFLCAWEQARPDGHKFATLISAAGHTSLSLTLGARSS